MVGFFPRRLDEEGNVEKISVRELFGDKKGVLVGVPGAFTPTCSKIHLPEFVDNAGVLAAKVSSFSALLNSWLLFCFCLFLFGRGGGGDLTVAVWFLVDCLKYLDTSPFFFWFAITKAYGRRRCKYGML